MKETIKSICPASGKCSGCQLGNLNYEEQLKLKQKKLNSLMYGICRPEKIVGSPKMFRYRNKASAVFFEDKNKNIRWGIYQSVAGSVCACGGCMLQPEAADKIFNDIAALLKSFKIKLYDPKSKTGFFRFARLRFNKDFTQAMLILVTADGEFPKARSFVNAVVKKHPEIVSVVQNVYTGDAVLMTGEKDTVLYGGGYVEDELCERRFRVSAQSFYQVNAAQTERLYSSAVELAELDTSTTFLDAYCGTGTVGIIAAKKAKRGIGVEINKSAVNDAEKNAALNLCENIKFYCGDAGEFLEKSGETFGVVFTDPPRAGCSKKFLNSLCNSGVKKVVYISCNPETLARDLRFLIKNGYSVDKLIPFDMFPQTSHIETVALLVRNISTKDYVTIEVRPEELELGSLKTHGTYEEIKSYVLNKYGFKISTLNISQVKRKCGLDVGEAYNKPKKQNSKVPNCSPEKEKAIMDALKHFNMI